MSVNTNQIDAHDLTVYPDGIDTYEKVNEFETYENTEFISEENHKRTILGLRKIQKLNNPDGLNDIWVMSYNGGFADDENPQPIRQLITGMNEERVYNFMFDYAYIGLTKDDVLWIEYYITKYRFNKIDESRSDKSWSLRMMLSQAYLGMYIDKRKIVHIRGIWS